nr:hypothetical protein [Tanacetum cinerariifolium]
MYSIPPMTSPIIDLTSRPESPKVHQQFKATTTETTTTTTITPPPPPAQQQITVEAMMMKRIGELEHIMANLIQENKEMEESEVVTDAVDWAMQALTRNRFRDLPEADMKEILHQHMWETESYKSHEDHMRLFEALKKSMNHDHSEELAQDLAEARKKKKKSREPSISLTPADLEIDEDMAPDEQAQSSDDEDIGSAHILKVNLRQDWWKPLKEERPATPEPAWSILPVTLPHLWTGYARDEAQRQQTITTGWSTGQVTIQSDYFFNKDLEYLRYDSKGSRPALSISKMKAAYYPDAGPEQMVPDQFWIDEECKYDIAVMTHMWILSVVRIEVFFMYGYDYMKKIVLRCADLNEHVIAERDFKYLYPSDFEDLYLLNLQGHLNHLPPKDKKILTTVVNQWTRHLVIRKHVEDFQLGIESYQTQVNLTKPQWDATGFKYKHDYIIIDSPRAVMFRDKYEVHMMMRFNEIHKFSDGTLQQINEALDYRVKEFRINRMNPGLNTRF